MKNKVRNQIEKAKRRQKYREIFRKKDPVMDETEQQYIEERNKNVFFNDTSGKKTRDS